MNRWVYSLMLSFLILAHPACAGRGDDEDLLWESRPWIEWGLWGANVMWLGASTLDLSHGSVPGRTGPGTAVSSPSAGNAGSSGLSDEEFRNAGIPVDDVQGPTTTTGSSDFWQQMKVVPAEPSGFKHDFADFLRENRDPSLNLRTGFQAAGRPASSPSPVSRAGGLQTSPGASVKGGERGAVRDTTPKPDKPVLQSTTHRDRSVLSP